MSIEGIFDEFDEEKKDEKSVTLEATEPSKEPEGDSVPEGEDKSKEEVVEETPAPSEEEGVADWFESAEEESAKDKLVDKQSVEESVDEKAEETPSEESPAIALPAVVVDDRFAPAEEEPAGDKPTEDKPVKEEEVVDTPAEETPAEAIEDWFEPSEEQAPAETPSEVNADAGAPISVEASPIVRQAVSAEVMKEQMRQFQNLKASLLGKSDIATIQNKPFIKRSGWRKLALAFNLSDEIIKAEKEIIGDEFEWRIWVKAWAPNGRFSTGIGACCSDERDFAHLRHDVYATAHTRAKNRALSDLIGSGEVSWEELRGMT